MLTVDHKPPPNCNVFGYVRVSTKMQLKNGSIKFQKKQIENWAREQGHNLVKIYEDLGISSRNTKKRLGFLEMDKVAEKGDIIAAVYTDRLFRDSDDMKFYQEKWERDGIYLEYIEFDGPRPDMAQCYEDLEEYFMKKLKNRFRIYFSSPEGRKELLYFSSDSEGETPNET